jgi:pentatricopeptide repeat protein
MRLPPLSLLAFPLSPPPACHHGFPTALFAINKRENRSLVNKVAANANAVKLDTSDKEHKTNRQRKKRRPQYNRLSTRQKSISRGNDPIISLNLNLDHLAKSTQYAASALRAEEMLLRIEALHADGYYEKSPDVVSYNCVINAYAHGKGVDDRLENGERLVRRMKERGIEPNEITFNTLLSCLLKEMEGLEDESKMSLRKEKVDKAESILATMEQMNLSNTRSYNTMISILSKSFQADAPQRAEDWLRHMMKQYELTGEERVEPDAFSFNSVIHAYANSINSKHPKQENNTLYAKKAEEFLNEMESLYNSGMESVQPDVVSYSAVINAYARAASKENEWCAVRAKEILEKIENNAFQNGTVAKNSIKPNSKTYSAVSFLQCSLIETAFPTHLSSMMFYCVSGY